MEQAIADLIRGAEAGSREVSEQLFAALYGELHELAARQLARGGRELTLGATSLLHMAYLSIAGREGLHFPDRARFMGYAARAMRGLVIDYARRSRAEKRGGGAFEITLADGADAGGGDARGAGAGDATPALELMSDALDELAALEPALAQVVDLHFFCGFTFAEIAAMRGVSDRTVKRDWRKARLFLSGALRDKPP